MHPKEVDWNMKKIVFGWTYCLFIGAGAAIAGMGGGTVMTPFMYAIDVYPKSASATALQLIFVSRIVVTILNWFSGVLLIDYMFFIGAFILVGAFVADNLSTIVQKRLKRQSFIASIYTALILICTSIFIVSSVKQLVAAKESGRSVVQFGDYCPK